VGRVVDTLYIPLGWVGCTNSVLLVPSLLLPGYTTVHHTHGQHAGYMRAGIEVCNDEALGSRLRLIW